MAAKVGIRLIVSGIDREEWIGADERAHESDEALLESVQFGSSIGDVLAPHVQISPSVNCCSVGLGEGDVSECDSVSGQGREVTGRLDKRDSRRRGGDRRVTAHMITEIVSNLVS